MTGLNFPTKAQRFDYLNKKEIEDKLDIDLDLLDLSEYAKLEDLTPLLSKDEASTTYATKAELGSKADQSEVTDLSGSLTSLEALVGSLQTRIEALESNTEG